MKKDKEAFQKARSMIDTIKLFKYDEELMNFLSRQDSLSLSQLKVYCSDSGFPSSLFMKIGLACNISATTFNVLFLIKAKDFFPSLPIIPLLFLLFTTGCIFWFLFQVIKWKRKPVKLTSHFEHKSGFAKMNNMIDLVLEQRYKNTLKHD
ncbi:hypothetical protein P9D34_07510 [Bacillus swezeyi]|uniref:Uncharacterized protein n=1 Tax=Bacillus swezeyi TaxID=1925020 RepID=A0A1R1S3A8_9BACI|nr:hypothetical protein [Bacillus swezeyi]MEC1260297.1 hypothetical protein [Bacillus swezeyi]MED2929904.1 hypothetical protein [Bacillus swezeyi]MED2942831.1 hypothetical protein [Bacillus swezeyi]MED2964682.1 hypothetical protein [Bacillus swezeyi]MED2976503.1 hypothetical protein [Bacillus swezeyi]